MLTIATEDVEDEYEDVERAHLIVRKFTNDELVVQGRNVTVTLEIFNGGPA
jgi:translocon-associated protein subunit beta